jgi:predicted MFS family arabinose efflux permease
MSVTTSAAFTSTESVWTSYRSLDRRIWIIAGTRAINTMGFSIVMPFMAMYLVEKRHATGALYGTVYFLAGLAAALSNALSGELSDRMGRRRVMLAALGVRTLNMMALGVAVLAHAPLAVLGMLIVVNGFLRSLFEPAASAAVTELCPIERRTAAYGLQRIGVNLGWALGPALGGALAAAHSYGGLFFLAAAITVLAALALSRITDPQVHPYVEREGLSLEAVRAAWQRNRPFFVYLVLVFAGSTLTVQQFSTLSVYVKTQIHLSEATIGLLYTINGVLVVLLQVPAVRFIDEGGPRRALVFGPALYTLAFLGIGAAGSFRGLALAMALLTAGEVVFSPALSDMAAHLGDPRHLGRAFGLFGLMQQLGLSMGPLVGGLVYDHLRGAHLAMWGTFAAGMVVIGAGYAAFASHYRLSWRRPHTIAG